MATLGWDSKSDPVKRRFQVFACEVPGRVKMSGEELYTALKREGVLVRFWNKPILKEFLRITVGTPAENDALLEKLKFILR